MQLRYIEMSDQSQCILNTVGVKSECLDRRDGDAERYVVRSPT